MGNKVSVFINEDKEVKKFNIFPSNDVREWSTYFKKEYSDRFMTINDFEHILQTYLNISNTNPIANDTESKLLMDDIKLISKLIFVTLNISNSNKVDFNEIMIGFSILTKGSFLEKVRWLFRFYDSDNDGLINKNEFIKIHTALCRILKCENTMSFNQIFEEKTVLNFSDFEKICKKKSENLKTISQFIYF